MRRPFVTLFGQQLSWYSTKVRAYLKFKGIDFYEESPTLVTYYWTIARRFGNPAMPAVPQGHALCVVDDPAPARSMARTA